MTDSPTSDPRPRVASSTNERLVALFPEMSDGTVRRRPRRRWPAFAAVAVIAAGTATGVVATNASGSAATSYRTATVATHDVDAVLDAVATIEPVSQAAVAFPVAGTVSGVDVALGDTVSVGQRLATLDTTSLQATLHTRQAALAAAKLTLTKALESSAAAEAATTTTTSAARSATGATGSSGATGSTSLAPAQQKVIAAQRDVDTALAASATAAASSDTVCAGVTTVALTTAPGDAAALATTTTTTTTAPAAGTDALTACRQALATELAARTTLSTAQQTLSSAANALDAIIEQRAATTATTSAASTGTTTRSTSSSGSSSSTSPSGFSGGSPSSATPSTEDLIADQQAVDAAFAQVAVATQAIDQATIVSPIQGTVVAVALTAGDSVTAASSTSTVTIVGNGGYEITTRVAVDHIAAVKVGQTASVTPDGGDRRLEGQVVSVAAAPETSSSTTTYLVVIGLHDPDVDLDNGSTGSVSIITEQARSAVAVPTSAVTTRGTRHFVSLLDGTTATETAVEVGVVGNEWTEIRSGVTVGRRVVLADLDAALPGSATATTNTGTGSPNGGGFPTGGFPGGGFPGGGFPGGGAPPGG